MLKVIKYYLTYSKKHWLSGLIVFPVYAVALILINTIKPLTYKEIIDTMAGGITLGVGEEIMQLFVILGIIIFVAQTFFRIGDYTITYFQSKVLKIMEDDTFWRMHHHATSFFEDNFTGSLVTKARRFVRSYETTQDTLIWNIWFAFVTCASILVALVFISPTLSLFFFIWTCLYIWITWIFIKFKRPKDIAKAKQDSKVTGKLADTLTNFLNIKMFASKKREMHLFMEATERERIIRSNAWRFGNHQNLMQGFLLGFVLELGMMYFVINLWLQGQTTVGTVILVQSYLISIFGQLWTLGKGLTRLAEAFSDAQEMIDILEQDIDVKDPKNPEKLQITKGKVTFHNVDFEYNKNISIFKKFNITIESGEKIGLVGHSGAGKTTIMKLLLRFNNLTGGTVYIDEQDITKITQDDLRSKIAYVPQEPILFHRTLGENIAYGKDGATEKEVLEAAKKAHAHNFISNLPNGYDTLVGERGIKLSGGERQRVAIARAMLKDAPILVLDEATSALDSMSEKHIQEAFTELMKDKTTIVIAHRLSTIQKMDRILVMEDGYIKESGTHTELLKDGKIYKAFWNQQAGGFIT